MRTRALGVVAVGLIASSCGGAPAQPMTLDGDGKTSLFTRTGTVDPKAQRLRSATQIFIDDEFE